MQGIIKEYVRISFKGGQAYDFRHSFDATWRISTKMESYKLRKTEGLVQARSGKRRDHDAIFVELFEPGWTHTSKIKNMSEQPRERSRQMLVNILELWDLPLPFYAVDPKRIKFSPSSDSKVELEDLLTLSVNSFPKPSKVKSDAMFSPQGRQFECVVDNQVLADILNGRSALGLTKSSKRAKATPVVRACAEIIANFFEKGWNPKYKIGDVVRWRCRALNQAADLAGRYAIKNKGPLAIFAPDYKERLAQAQWIQIHTDGGKEAAGASASLTIMIWTGIPEKPVREYLCVRAEFLTSFVTPFHAEALALLSALRVFYNGVK